MLELAAAGLWWILPAYFANATPVVLKGRTPIDGNARFLDGRPILGKAKTIRGFLSGIGAGAIVGVLQGLADPAGSYLTLAILVSLGAMVGDSIGAFVKRRFDLPPGAAAPFLDQWDFVFGALAFGFAGSVFLATPFPGTNVVLAILVLTAFLHVATNFVAFKLGLKKVPW
jgi:CDP-2,3-bis-(O-geranylgeranyl)-sn-glycerol synthase